MSSEAPVERTPEELAEHALEQAKFDQAMADMRRQLKQQSKNQLIATVQQMMHVLMESNRMNKFLNEQLKELSKEPTK